MALGRASMLSNSSPRVTSRRRWRKILGVHLCRRVKGRAVQFHGFVDLLGRTLGQTDRPQWRPPADASPTPK
jgi:hypothetical protein